ncbi:ExbD/TolR family protein [Limnoglobus roseus]|uniref:Biopolymer transporter ExbD n=1 Tax=Limnoglobus roseus TaxID=2598579 RepID=A0A5C1AGL3_9BACT|nr:biopolymer transporter ExbD [Limnoglobus roseus]QEL16882.1 biopolymer transporter ExbD [Limnoglobus roseus]
MSRRRRHASNPFVEPDLPITPMLDMSFQLLAFFLMTFNPTPTEGHLDVTLPKRDGGPSTKLPDPFTTDEAEEFTIRVEADDKGDVGSVSISVGKEGGGVDVPGKGREARTNLFKDLQNRLAAAKNDHAERNKSTGESKPFVPPKIKLELANELNFKIVIAIMDESNRAGYPTVAPALKDDKK